MVSTWKEIERERRRKVRHTRGRGVWYKGDLGGEAREDVSNGEALEELVDREHADEHRERRVLGHQAQRQPDDHLMLKCGLQRERERGGEREGESQRERACKRESDGESEKDRVSGQGVGVVGFVFGRFGFRAEGSGVWVQG